MKIVLCAALASGAIARDGTESPRWQPIGATDSVQWHDGQLQLAVEEAVSAGLVSNPIRLPRGADALMFQCVVDAAPARGLTLAAHDAATGDPLGYWQNLPGIAQPTNVAVILPLAAQVPAVRGFVGTDGRPSSAQLHDIRVRPLRRAMVGTNPMYGAVADANQILRQTFFARGTEMGGLSLRIRHLTDDQPRADLRVRLCEWGDGAVGATVAETVLSAGLVPIKRDHEEITVSVPLSAPVKRGATYAVELALNGASAPGQGYLFFAGPDNDAQGELYKNNAGTGWDLFVEMYDAAW